MDRLRSPVSGAATSVNMDLDSLIGPAAGIATSVLWVATTLFFTAAGKRIGSTMVNFVRIIIAIVLLGVTHRLFSGQWWPDASDQQLFYLALSGLIGLTICDQALFTAFLDIGPRRASLIMTTTPLFAAAFAWFYPPLAERISVVGVLGILLTIGGVAWVILERSHLNADDQPHPHFKRGLVLAFIAAICQGVGLVFSKLGIGHGVVDESAHLGPQAATFVRMIFGGIGMLPIMAVYIARRKSESHARSRNTRVGSRSVGYLFTTCGAIVGPYFGVWMSLVAVHYTQSAGVAQTLCSLTPVFILPILAVFYKEHITPRAIVGAVVAVAGVAILTFNSAMS